MIPKHLKPDGVLDIMVPVVSSDVADRPELEEFVSQLSKIDASIIPKSMMKDLIDIGHRLATDGAVQMANGSSYIANGVLIKLMMKMTKDALESQDHKTTIKLAEAVAKLATTLERHNKLIKSKSEESKPDSGNRRGLNVSFPPGSLVQFNTIEAPKEKIITVAKD